MLGYKITKIRKSNQGYDYEAAAFILVDLKTGYVLGMIYFNKVADSDDIKPVRVEYDDPETGHVKVVTL